jgi:hypothetical protein
MGAAERADLHGAVGAARVHERAVSVDGHAGYAPRVGNRIVVAAAQ